MTSGAVEDDKNRSANHQPPPPPPPPPAFQGVSNYPPPQQQQSPPATGFPQPYVTGYPVTGEIPAREQHRLPCCGIGVGWVLFILGFFFGIPWYIGVFLQLRSKNPRERPGYIACTVAAAVATFIIVYGAMRGSGRS